MLPKGLTPEDFDSGAPRYEGSLALGQMARLAPLLAETEGEARLSMACGVDEQGRRYVEGSVCADLKLTCQRCLGVYYHSVDESFRVTLVDSEAEGEGLPEGLEPFVSPDGRLRPKDLAEEELLLAMPIVALHREGECNPPPNHAGVARQDLSPFAQLKGVFGEGSQG